MGCGTAALPLRTGMIGAVTALDHAGERVPQSVWALGELAWACLACGAVAVGPGASAAVQDPQHGSRQPAAEMR